MFKIIKKIIKNYLHVKYTKSSTTRKIMEQEERNGDIVSNKFRYIWGLLFLSIIIFNGLNDLKRGTYFGILFNVSAILIFLLFTIIHTIIIKKCDKKANNLYGYLATTIDFFIITLLVISWSLHDSPDNPAYLLKTPLIYYYIIPIIITVIQFQISRVLFSFLIFLLTYYSLVFYALKSGITLSSNWESYILGNTVVLSDILVTRPIIYLGSAISIGYAIYRSFFMLAQIGKSESQKKSLYRYFSHEVADEIINNPQSLTSGQRCNAAVLFCDIRNFTSFSEQLTTDELSRFLSNFRKMVTNSIFDFNGIIDKYIGDAVMAVFGVPPYNQNEKEICRNAVFAAIQIQNNLRKYNQKRIKFGRNPIEIGIGIHYGEVFAGSIGFEDRMEYTVIGDTVNVASRIEHLCRKFESTFLISDDLFQHVNNFISFEKKPRVKVKGKSNPIQVYEVNDIAG